MALNRREFLAVTTGASISALAGEVATEETMNDKTASTALDFLKQYPTTVLESAVALIRGGHKDVVCTQPGLLRRFASTERLVGYAVTARFSTDADDARGRRENVDYFHYIFKQPGPKVAISLDVSAQAGSGSSWGRVNANIHRALGCRGVITNGGVRDIEQFAKIGFQVFSAHLTVGHGNPHIISFGEPVELLGAAVRPGDVVCADQHGVIVIPPDALPHIADAVAEGERRVAPVIAYCQSPGFTVAGLIERQQKHMKNAPAWQPGNKRKPTQ